MALSPICFTNSGLCSCVTFSCLHISQAHRGQRLCSLVAPDLLVLPFQSVWAPSAGYGQHPWGTARTEEQLLWAVPASPEPSHPAMSMGSARQALHSLPCPAGRCLGVHKQKAWAGRFVFISQSVSDKSECPKKYVHGLNRKVYTWKVLWVHAQAATAEMTPDQSPAFGRKFRLLC